MTDTKVFDPGRAMLEDYLDSNLYPARLMVNETVSLEQALNRAELQLDTRLLNMANASTLFRCRWCCPIT